MDNKKTSQTVQQARISDKEKNLLRNTFSENEDLLIALRNLFFGFEMNEGEKIMLKRLESKEVRKLLRKIFLPELEKDIPIGQSIDLWATLNIEGKDFDQISRSMLARISLIKHIETVLALLENPNGKKVNLWDYDLITTTASNHELLARNTFISHIELQLAVIRMLANSVEETPEQLEARIKADSSK